MPAYVVVRGADDVIQAFARAKIKVDPAVGKALRELAKPVQRTGQELAVANITNIGPRWSRFRIGRKKTYVYVAEREHGRGGPARANFFPLVMDTALRPALEQHRQEIESGMEAVIDGICKAV